MVILHSLLIITFIMKVLNWMSIEKYNERLLIWSTGLTLRLTQYFSNSNFGYHSLFTTPSCHLSCITWSRMQPQGKVRSAFWNQFSVLTFMDRHPYEVFAKSFYSMRKKKYLGVWLKNWSAHHGLEGKNNWIFLFTLNSKSQPKDTNYFITFTKPLSSLYLSYN